MTLTFQGRKVDVDFSWLGLGTYFLERCYWEDTGEPLTEDERQALREDDEIDIILCREAAEFRRGF